MRLWALTLGIFALAAPLAAWADCPGYVGCPAVNYPAVLHAPATQAVVAQIDAQRQAAVQAALVRGIPFDQLIAQIGRAIVSDRRLSVNNTEACALCHNPASGFAGGIAAFSAGGGVFPGARPWRAGFRNPQSLAYAAFAPNLSFNATTGVFTGGAFWDMRATGQLTGSAAGDQALTPLTSPFEMALPDAACAVYRLQYTPYAKIFSAIWGANSFHIAWPAGTVQFCATPNNGNGAALALAPADRAQANQTVNFITQTILAYEESALSSPFSAKYDAMLAGTAQFTPVEAAGLALFSGRAQCSTCHSLGTPRALLSNFTSANLGVPRNAALAYLRESRVDPAGYVANPAGQAFVDKGLGGFLASAENTNPAWAAQAAQFTGWFQVPSLRNVAAGGQDGQTRAYTHNGYFKSLRDAVHFLNTRDALPRCAGEHGIGVTCWPAPEVENGVTQSVGHLGLTGAEENALVAFLGTLTDGYKP